MRKLVSFDVSCKVLTLKQPWASLVAWGFKKIENRTWETNYRGPLAIHAGSGNDGQLWDALVDDPFHLWHLEELAVKMGLPWEDLGRLRSALPRGKVVAVANLTDCVTDHPSEWFDGPFGFVLSNILRLEDPIPATGNLGLRSPDPHVARWIQGALVGGRWTAPRRARGARA